MKPASAQSRLHPAYIEAFLERHKISLRQIEDGRPVWPTAQGKVALTIEDIERLISIDDPVAWAWLNLVERKSAKDDDGVVAIPAGVPWGLFEVQANLARTEGDLIIECGSEVGKTRDIVLRCLWKMDTAEARAETLVACDSDNTIEPIWDEIEFQLGENPSIGGGVTESRVKPYRQKTFANGNVFQIRLCGLDGSQFRGAHPNQDVLADEAAKWKNPRQWSELWRAGMPGVRFRIYSTPDGDYSSPFYRMCAQAIPIDGSRGSNGEEKSSETPPEDEPNFRKINITKYELPPPFWTETRAARLRVKYHGEQSVEWKTNVLGQWGTPSFSVFPMQTLSPCLFGSEKLPHYRMVSVMIDRNTGRVHFTATRLAPRLDGTSGEEEVLAREITPFVSGAKVGETVADFFPKEWVAGLTSPLLFCGADLGFSQDPTELIFVQQVGNSWLDVFRLHLENADAPEQAAILAWLDHASGHQVRYGLDNGSAGSALISDLTQRDEYHACPAKYCEARIYLAERLFGFGFGNAVDEIDIETGEAVLNHDRIDKSGEPQPNRINNKEFSTRILERKMQAKLLVIAADAGAGNPNHSAPQLLVNHTWLSMNNRRERTFKGTDDHHVDARRQAALIIASGLRNQLLQPSKETFASNGPRKVVDSVFQDAMSLRNEFGQGVSRGLARLEW